MQIQLNNPLLLSRSETRQQYINTSSPNVRFIAQNYPNAKIHGLQYDFNRITGNPTTFDVLDILKPYSGYTQLAIQWPIYEAPPLSTSFLSLADNTNTNNNISTNKHDTFKVEYSSLLDFLGNKHTLRVLPDQRKMIDILTNGPLLIFSYLDIELIQLASHYLQFFKLAAKTTKPPNHERACPVLLYTRKTTMTTILLTSSRPLLDIHKLENALPPEVQIYWLTWPEKLLLLLLICYNQQLPRTCNSLHKAPLIWDKFTTSMSGSFRSTVLALKMMDSTGASPLFIPDRTPMEKLYGDMFTGVLNYSDLLYRIQRGMLIETDTTVFRKESMEKFFFLIYVIRIIRNHMAGGLPARVQLGLIRTMFANTHTGIEKGGFNKLLYTKHGTIQKFLNHGNRRILFETLYNQVCALNRAFEDGPENTQLPFFASSERASHFYSDLCDAYSYIPKISWYINSIGSAFNSATTMTHVLPSFIPCNLIQMDSIETEDLLLYNCELDLLYQWKTETLTSTLNGLNVNFIIHNQLAIRVREYINHIYPILNYESTPNEFCYSFHKSSHLPNHGFLIADIVYQPLSGDTAVLLCGNRMSLYTIQLLSWCQAVAHNQELNLEIDSYGCSLFHVLNGLVHITREPYNNEQKGSVAFYHVIIALRVLLLGHRLEKLASNTAELKAIQLHATRVYKFVSEYLYMNPSAEASRNGDLNIRMHWDQSVFGNLSNFLLTLFIFPFAKEIRITSASETFIDYNQAAMKDISESVNNPDYEALCEWKQEAGNQVRNALNDFSLLTPTRVFCSGEVTPESHHLTISPEYREGIDSIFHTAIDSPVDYSERYSLAKMSIYLISAYCPVLPVNRCYLLKLLPSVTIPEQLIDIPALRNLTPLANVDLKSGEYNQFTYMRSTESKELFPHYASSGFINVTNIIPGNSPVKAVEECKKMIHYGAETLIDLTGNRINNTAVHESELTKLNNATLYTPTVYLNGLIFSESMCLPAFYPDGSVVNPVMTSLLASIPNRPHLSAQRVAIYQDSSKASKSLQYRKIDPVKQYESYVSRHRVTVTNTRIPIPKDGKQLKRQKSESDLNKIIEGFEYELNTSDNETELADNNNNNAMEDQNSVATTVESPSLFTEEQQCISMQS